MADFTGFNIPKPGQINYPSAGAGSGALGGLGTVLEGAAGIVGLYKENEKAHAGDQAAKALADLTQEQYGAKPAMVGEANPDSAKAAAESSPVVGNATGQVGRLNQAYKQGSMTQTEFYTRASVIVQDAINKDPQYAAQIREKVQGVLGTQPTQELLKLAGEQSKAITDINNAVRQGNVLAAANHGITFRKDDGSIDVDRMDVSGQTIRFTEASMDNAVKEAQLKVASAGPAVSFEERNSIEAQSFLKQYNPVMQKVTDGLLASAPALYSQFANMKDEERAAKVLEAIGLQKTAFMNNVNSALIKYNYSPEASDKVRKQYNAVFDTFTTLAASGDFSHFKVVAEGLKAMEASDKMSLLKGAPVLRRLNAAAGPAGVSAGLSLFMGTNTPFRESYNSELAAGLNGHAEPDPATVLDNHATILEGGAYNMGAEQNPRVQAATVQAVAKTITTYAQTPTLLKPNEQKSFGNGVTQLSALGLKSNDPKNLNAAAEVTNSPQVLATFDNFAKNPDNANQVPGVAQGMIALNTKSVLRNIPVLMQGVSVKVDSTDTAGLAADFAAGGNPYTGITVKAVPHFNTASGRVGYTLVGNDVNGQNVRLSPDQEAQAVSQMQEYTGQVAAVNRSLDAVVHLAPHGVGRETEFKPLEIKQLLTSGAGLQVKEGQKPIPMPKFVKQGANEFALPQNIADAQIKQESGGQNGIVSAQGAVGVAQIRPSDFPQYDANRLKNDPKYALAARDEIMSGLLKKYNGNTALALAEYHGGPDQKQWGPKTFGYVSTILSNANQQGGTGSPAAPFEEWKAKLPANLQNDSDYDLKGAFAAGVKPSANAHLPDTFKLPNHMTFSKESQYSGKDGNVGGEWKDLGHGKWSFTPSATNLKYHSKEELKAYFEKYEPDSTLILPKGD